MTSISLNIAGKIDSQTVAVLEAVSHATASLNLPYVVVGATARDLVLHYGHGAKIQRATHDIDFAIEVPDWSAFSSLKDYLCERGFRKTKVEHRLIGPANTVIDIVPFGDVEDHDSSILWPPKGDISMNVLGFQEACDNAEWVRVQDDPVTDVPVATPAGMMLLKLISWTDRASDLRSKDAKDIAYLLLSYEAIGDVEEALFSDTKILEIYDYHITHSAAHLLGQHASNLARVNTRKAITDLADGRLGSLTTEHLVGEMCEIGVDTEYERNQLLLSAFMDGFNSLEGFLK